MGKVVGDFKGKREGFLRLMGLRQGFIANRDINMNQ